MEVGQDSRMYRIEGRKGKERGGKGRKGKEREGKERKGEERRGKGRVQGRLRPFPPEAVLGPGVYAG